jgi:hypothetical protein
MTIKDLGIFMQKLDKQRTQKLFNFLKDGSFLSQNTPSKEFSKLYTYCENNYEEIKDIFEYIGVTLMLKNGYCYFSSLEYKDYKLQNILDMIEMLSFFQQFNTHFDVGFRFSINEIYTKVLDDVTLKYKLNKFKNINNDNLRDSIKSLLTKLKNRGFVAIEDEYLERYIVLDSINYLNEFFAKIEIKE